LHRQQPEKDKQNVDVAPPIEKFLRTPMPVGIVADKRTMRRRTGQIFAAVLFTPGMPSLASASIQWALN